LCTQLTQYHCHRRPSHCGKPRGVRSGPWVNPRLLCYSYPVTVFGSANPCNPQGSQRFMEDGTWVFR
jgi:hypothetical protein